MNNNSNNKLKYILSALAAGLLAFSALFFGAMSVSFMFDDHEIGLSVFMAGITAFSAFGCSKLKKYSDNLKNLISQIPMQYQNPQFPPPGNYPNYSNNPNYLNNPDNNIYNSIPTNPNNFNYAVPNAASNPQNAYTALPPNDNMRKINLMAVRIMRYTDDYNICREETPEFVKIHIVQPDGKKRGIVKISRTDLSIVYRDLSRGTAIVRELSDIDEVQRYL